MNYSVFNSNGQFISVVIKKIVNRAVQDRNRLHVCDGRLTGVLMKKNEEVPPLNT